MNDDERYVVYALSAMALILAGTVLLFAAANLVKAFVKKNVR